MLARFGEVSTTRVRRTGALIKVGVRRALYPLVALPMSIGGLVLGGLGKARRASRLQRALLRRLLDLSVTDPSDRQVVTHSALSLPINLAAFPIAAYLWLILLVNFGYPLRPDTTSEAVRDSWGGPTLAGAWTVHAAGAALVFLLVGLPIMAGIAWLQGRLAHRLLADPGPGRRTPQAEKDLRGPRP